MLVFWDPWGIFLEVELLGQKINPKRPASRHITIKMVKLEDKDRILKAARHRQSITYKGAPSRISAAFSAETLQFRRN